MAAISASDRSPLKAGMPPRPLSTRDTGLAFGPTTNGSPARAGKAPFTPMPSGRWQAEQLAMNIALPGGSAAKAGPAARAARARAAAGARAARTVGVLRFPMAQAA